jgi:serine protease Do
MPKRNFRLAAIILVSLLAGFFLGSTRDFLLQRLIPVSDSGQRRVRQVSFADISDRVAPSVVSVVSSRLVDVYQIREGYEGLAPGRPEGEGRQRSLGYGSGFILDGRGLIITSEHVIDDSRHITVRLYNGREYPANLLGVDREMDVALLRINASERLVPVQLGDSDQLRVGDWVMAVGNPYNYDHTVTVGVVSAKDRKIDDNNPFEQYIQTDAAINYGNSGGPLFNGQGQVVAINSAISTKGRGIGFSIPINSVKDIFKQLELRGRVIRGYLGLGPDSITEEYARLLHLPSRQGVLVVEVAPDSAAAKSGIKRYDVITGIDGLAIQGKDDFFRKIASTSPGTRLLLKGLRDQKEIEFDVIIRERQALGATLVHPRRAESEKVIPPGSSATQLGIAVQELTVEHRELLRLDDSQAGVVIVSVNEFSLGADAGLSPGDVIVEINRCPVRSLAQYQKLVAEFRKDGLFILLVRRPNGSCRLATLSLENR